MNELNVILLADGYHKYSFEQEKSEANFIIRLMIVTDLAFVKSDQNKTMLGKIIAIPNADTGFDWVSFTKYYMLYHAMQNISVIADTYRRSRYEL